ncbi:MAG: hypothetical protein ABIJ25_09935, partial [Pseudomonadota bacterium]
FRGLQKPRELDALELPGQLTHQRFLKNLSHPNFESEAADGGATARLGKNTPPTPPRKLFSATQTHRKDTTFTLKTAWLDSTDKQMRVEQVTMVNKENQMRPVSDRWLEY